jgi:hypothetical protein
MGWTLVPVLRLSPQDKAEEPEVQGEAQGQNQNSANEPDGRFVCPGLEGGNKTENQRETG